MKILFLSTYYKRFLAGFHKQLSEIETLDFNVYSNLLAGQLFGHSNFNVINFRKLGYDADEIVINDTHFIYKWFQTWASDTKWESQSISWQIIKMIEIIQPHIIYDDSGGFFSVHSMLEVKRKVKSIKVIVAWDGYIASNSDKYLHYDLMLTCVPDILEKYRQRNKAAHIIPFGFETSILEKIGFDAEEPKSELVFIGSITPKIHKRRIEILTLLKAKTNLELYLGNGMSFQNTLFHAFINPKLTLSIIQLQIENSGELYGKGMYNLLSKTNIALNIHSDGIEYGGNMRLFEIAGMGVCQLVDWKQNLSDYLEDGKEMVTFTSKTDALDKAHYLLQHPDESRRIAKAGQKKICEKFSYFNRVCAIHQVFMSCIN